MRTRKSMKKKIEAIRERPLGSYRLRILKRRWWFDCAKCGYSFGVSIEGMTCPDVIQGLSNHARSCKGNWGKEV